MADTLSISTLNNPPKFDDWTDYRLCAKKVKMIVNISNKDILDVLGKSSEPEDIN